MKIKKQIVDLLKQTDLWWSKLPAADEAMLHRIMIYSNLLRIRIAIGVMIISMTLIIVFDLSYHFYIAKALSPSFTFQHIDKIINFMRFTMIIVSIVFLKGLPKPSSPDEIRPRHNRFVFAYLLFVLIYFALINAAFQIKELNIPSTYIMIVAISAAFLFLKAREFIITYSFSGLLMMLLLVHFQADFYVAWARCINVGITTFIAFIISRVVYSTRLKDFINQQLIEHQRDELAHSNDMLYRLAYLDALTGIPNRRYFEEILDQEWRQAIRDKTRIAFMMIDIDNFKLFNDSFGHQNGDECLIKVATTLAKSIKRPRDVMARYGGEEFAAILPTTNLEGALRIADKLRLAVGDLNIRHSSSPHLVVTISIGLACLQPSVGDKYETLIADADDALYQAKALGRNRIVWTSP